MQEKQLFIKADVFNIKFLTECKEAEEYIKKNIDEFIRLTINFEIIDEEIKHDLTLIYKNSNDYNITINRENKELIFECPWKQIDESTVLPMIFRYIVEWLRQEKDEIKVHGSAVEKNGKVALFMAPSEGGKTTTAMAMCQKYECSLKANDAAVIKFKDECPFMIRGDTVFKVRFNGLQAYSKEMFKQKTGSDESKSNVPWFEKLKINPEEMGVSFDNQELPVKYIFFVKLDPLVSGCSVKKYNDNHFERREQWFKPKMQILQNIGGTIRGNDLTPIGNKGDLLPIEIPFIDTKELYLKRIEFINKLFDKCEIYQLRGQLEEMTQFINEILS